MFTLEYAVGENQTATYQIMTISGQIVQSSQLQVGTDTQQVNTSQLQQGIYLLNVFVDGNLIETKKLVIIRE